MQLTGGCLEQAGTLDPAWHVPKATSFATAPSSWLPQENTKGGYDAML